MRLVSCNQRQGDLALQSIELRILLPIPEQRQSSPFFARVVGVDVIREVVVERAQRPVHPVVGMPMNSDVHCARSLRAEPFVAELAPRDSEMWAVGIELNRLRVALRPCEIGRE